MSAWGDVGSPEGLKKTILAIIVGIVLKIMISRISSFREAMENQGE